MTATPKPKRRRPGLVWRLLSKHVDLRINGSDQFDELVIDQWLHIEQMSTRSYWIGLCGLHINVTLNTDGTADVNVWDDHKEVASFSVKRRPVFGGKWWRG